MKYSNWMIFFLVLIGIFIFGAYQLGIYATSSMLLVAFVFLVVIGFIVFIYHKKGGGIASFGEKHKSVHEIIRIIQDIWQNEYGETLLKDEDFKFDMRKYEGVNDNFFAFRFKVVGSETSAAGECIIFWSEARNTVVHGDYNFSGIQRTDLFANFNPFVEKRYAPAVRRPVTFEMPQPKRRRESVKDEFGEEERREEEREERRRE